MSSATSQNSDDLLVCVACGTQYEVECPSSISSTLTFIPASGDLPLQSCRTCDDPRQYVPPDGQKFTTLNRLREAGNFRNIIEQHKEDERIWEIWTETKFGIGQRAILIQTPHGNVLWDLVAYLDQDTIDRINDLGGLKAIVISHPHFYTTWADWSMSFGCPVYMAEQDANEWAQRTTDPKAQLRMLKDQRTTLLPGLTAVIAGGHFPGSLFMHSEPPNTTIPSIFVADTIMAIPSGRNPDPGKSGVSSFAFMWSIPNMIPLPPDTVFDIWKAIKPFDFLVSYGNMKDMGEVRQRPDHRISLKERLLQSAKVHCQHEGYDNHPILNETC